jgi:hypothetical protein
MKTATINAELSARLLTHYTAPSTGWAVEVWVIHERDNLGASTQQVEIYRHAGRWFPWTGSIIRAEKRAVAERLAEVRNG